MCQKSNVYCDLLKANQFNICYGNLLMEEVSTWEKNESLTLSFKKVQIIEDSCFIYLSIFLTFDFECLFPIS